MRKLDAGEIKLVYGGNFWEKHTPSFAIANMLTFAGISTLLALGLGKEALIGAMLAEGIYGGTLYFVWPKTTAGEQLSKKGELPHIVKAEPA